MFAGAEMRTCPVCFVAAGEKNGPTGYGPRYFGSLALGRSCRTVIVATHSGLAGSLGTRTVQTGLVASLGRTTVASIAVPVVKGTARSTTTSAFAGKCSGHSVTAPRIL